MKRIKISSILFWGYLLFVYLVFVGILVYYGVKVRTNPPEVDLSDYHSAIKIQPVDTLVIQGDADIVIQYKEDVNMLAFNDTMSFNQNNKTLYLPDGADVKLVIGKPGLVIVVDSTADIAFGALENVELIANGASIDLASGRLERLSVSAENSDIELAVPFVKTIELDLHSSKMQIASVKVKSISGFADSLSTVEVAKISSGKVDVSGGANVSVNR